MLLTISRKTHSEGIVVVALCGRLTLGEESLRAEQYLRALAGEGPLKVILDLSELTYMDSAGMGAIAKSMVVITEAGGKLRLAGTTQRVASALKVTKLDLVFPMYPDLQSASANY